MDLALLLLVAAALLLTNAAGVVMVALQLPGTWLMLAATAAAAWWGWSPDPGLRWIGWGTLAALGGLALLGEVVEAVAGALGSRQAGGSRRGALLAIAGGIAGAIGGTFALPIPIVGTLLGASVGAGAGSMLGDAWAGRDLSAVWAAGRGAAIGKFAGSVGKLGIAIAMFVLVAAALVF
ncbi:DUF456 domain-containing protein [Phycisphaera mikurensis]|uniref:DUF456 family protein n=1 Tax=Phycisphaera mikurensis (strain NBRC 102666 / KCTC 22515 / FYK2301M01) TaxID=1142394 RepID=I0IEM6_PHYMF|nr:DUF456 domain-containing protein [Phycisphaera mikurensis]MBB6441512.1 hypothetical protein [Phycisphaera mikurensis]BAM03714.1 hypothetical protein PSMK_15550 [Phycisphaera mikurensis NBRC 102666]